MNIFLLSKIGILNLQGCKPVQKHNIKIHLFIPYLSYIAWNKLNELSLLTCFDVIVIKISNETKNVLYFFQKNAFLKKHQKKGVKKKKKIHFKRVI